MEFKVLTHHSLLLLPSRGNDENSKGKDCK